jgi:hypothetical protein
MVEDEVRGVVSLTFAGWRVRLRKADATLIQQHMSNLMCKHGKGVEIT